MTVRELMSKLETMCPSARVLIALNTATRTEGDHG